MTLVDRRSTALAWLAVGLAIGFATWRLAVVAAGVPLWYDELLTVRVSEVEGVANLWRAIGAGFDFTPPLIYVATKAAHAIHPADPLGARLPALAGFVLFAVGLVRWLTPRVGAWAAAAAVALTPLADYTVRYAVEARPYMLLLGVSMWALVCWQRLRDRPGAAAAVGFWALLTCALLLHVWAGLLLMAMGAGELAAAVRSRAVRWRVAIPMAAALPVLGIHAMLLRGTKTMVFENAAYLPSTAKLTAALLSAVPRPRVLAATLVVAAIAGWLARRKAHGAPTEAVAGPALPHGLAADERVMLLACVLSPLVPFIYATIGRSPFMPRYALYSLLGVVCLSSDLLRVLARPARHGPMAAALVALVGLGRYLPARTQPIVGTQTSVADALAGAHGLPDGVPIVLVNPIDVLTFEMHASDAWLARSVFVADGALARAYTGTDAIDLGYIRGEPYLRLRSKRLEYGDLQHHERLLLVGKWQTLTWLPQRLRDDGWRIERWGGTPQAPIYDAIRPALATVGPAR
ncbi:MAG: hypothetical protein ABIT71_13910 [Vicinamibacteraceae bacterium]